MRMRGQATRRGKLLVNSRSLSPTIATKKAMRGRNNNALATLHGYTKHRRCFVLLRRHGRSYHRASRPHSPHVEANTGAIPLRDSFGRACYWVKYWCVPSQATVLGGDEHQSGLWEVQMRIVVRHELSHFYGCNGDHGYPLKVSARWMTSSLVTPSGSAIALMYACKACVVVSAQRALVAASCACSLACALSGTHSA